MSALTAFGGLVQGLTNETAKIRQEREDKEQRNLNLQLSMFQHILENPQITNPQLKEEALHGMRDTVMQHLFPQNFKAKPGKLHKMVEQFVGDSTGGGPPMMPSMDGEGVGSGNAKPTTLGGIPPSPQMAMGGQGGVPPSPQQAGITTPSGFMDPAAQQAQQLSFEQQKQDMETKAYMDRNKVQMDGVNGGKSFDVRLAPIIDAKIRAQIPDVITHAQRSPEGHNIITLIDKNTQKAIGQIDTGLIGAGSESQFNLWYNQFVSEHGQPPSTKEQDEHAKMLQESGSELMLARAKELAQIHFENTAELGSQRTARSEVAKSAVDLKQAMIRLSAMRKAAGNIAAGSEAPGADDQALIAQHIGMTIGGVTGARIGRDQIEAHLKARDFASNVEVAVKRFLNGDALTPAQRREFIRLAEERVKDLQDAYVFTTGQYGYEPKGHKELIEGFTPSTLPGAPNSTVAPVGSAPTPNVAPPNSTGWKVIKVGP